MATSNEQKQSPASEDVDSAATGGKDIDLEEIVVCVPISQNCESLDVCIADIIWERLSNFHDISWLFDTNKVLDKTGGNELSVGATRTYIKGGRFTGGTETVVERDDTKRFLKWNLDSVKDYIASVEVFDTHIRFKNEGRLPKKVLAQAKKQLASKLTRVVAESEITEDDIINME